MFDASNGTPRERLTIKIPSSSQRIKEPAKKRSGNIFKRTDNVASSPKTRTQGQPSQDKASGSVDTRESLTIKIPVLSELRKRLGLRPSDRLAEQPSLPSIGHTNDVANPPKTRKRGRQNQDEAAADAPKAKRPKTRGTRKVPDDGDDGMLLDTEEYLKTLGTDAPWKISKGKEVDSHHALDYDGLPVGGQGDSKQSIGTDFTKVEEPMKNEEVNYHGYNQTGFPLGNQEDVSQATGPNVPKEEESKGKEKANDHDHDGLLVDNQQNDYTDAGVPNGEGTAEDNTHDHVPDHGGLTIDNQHREDPSVVQDQLWSEAITPSEVDLFFQDRDPSPGQGYLIYLLYHLYTKNCEIPGCLCLPAIDHIDPMDYDLYFAGLVVSFLAAVASTPPQGHAIEDMEDIIWQWIQWPEDDDPSDQVNEGHVFEEMTVP